MSKKSSKKAAAVAQANAAPKGESFFDQTAAAPNGAAPAPVSPAADTAAHEAGPAVLKRKRSYKPRAKATAAKAAASAGMSHQDAYQQGFKAGVKFAKMGA